MSILSKIKNWYQYGGLYDKVETVVSKRYRKKLKNKDFTIICPNCIGGQIYHRFGLRFDSPTINLSINTPDFVNFLNHFDYYIQQDLEETASIFNEHPSAVIKGNGENIPDIKLAFVHYKTFEEGQSKWYERRTRIHKDNLYLIMFDVSDLFDRDYQHVGYLSEEDIKAFDRFECNNKVLFTRRKDLDIPNAYYIKPHYSEVHPNSYFAKDAFGVRRYEHKFDLCKFFNTKNPIA